MGEDDSNTSELLNLCYLLAEPVLFILVFPKKSDLGIRSSLRTLHVPVLMM